jgi:14-3-3 protein epsilon
LLSVAFKNAVSSRRSAWRTISAIQNKEEYKGGKYLDLIKWYRQKIEGELDKICGQVLDLLVNHLIPQSTAADSKVFYMKMRGDYHRYLCEFFSGDK